MQGRQLLYNSLIVVVANLINQSFIFFAYPVMFNAKIDSKYPLSIGPKPIGIIRAFSNRENNMFGQLTYATHSFILQNITTKTIEENHHGKNWREFH